jgi:protein-S-isoprenylcysteine O-methyltransferase Ste14
MELNKVFRHIAGYIVGVTIFGILIPYGLIGMSYTPIAFLNFSIVDNIYIRFVIASLFLLVGLIFVIWSNIALLFIGKGGPADGFGVALSPRTKKLVMKGPYKYSRNPMVFGAFMCYFSIGFFCNSQAEIILLLCCIPVSIIYLKLTEEKRLIKDFGEEFIQYRQKVPMIFPLLFLKKLLYH